MKIKEIITAIKRGILKAVEFCKYIIKNRKALLETIKQYCKKIIEYVKNLYAYCKKAITGDDILERNRVLILLFSTLFIFNYLAFCLHADKNIFDIFPSIPPIEKKQTVTLYLPDSKAQTMLQEKREIPIFDKQENLLHHLFTLVVKGSVIHENTSMIVPMPLFVRHIWLYGQQEESCIIDVEPGILGARAKVVKGSEEMFKKALEQTIRQIVPTIKEVIILEKGIPNKALWEM